MASWARWWEGEGRSDADTMRRCPLSSVGGSPRLRAGLCLSGRGRGEAGAAAPGQTPLSLICPLKEM